MYLLAFGYYFVITFLGYNGTYQKHVRTYFNTNDNHSSTLPEPNGSPSRPHPGAGHSLVHQPVHFRLRDQPGASAMVWCEPS